MSGLTLDVGLAYKLKQARDRNGIPDNADFDWLVTGDNLVKVRQVRLGHLELTIPERLWQEQDGIIYFSVTSDGTTGKGWIKSLEAKGFRVNKYARSVLRSSDFKPTNSVTTEVAILKGMLFEANYRTTRNIRAEADKRVFTKPNAEIVCLIREKFSDEELEAMGLWWIVTMHEPIKDSGGDPLLLSAGRGGGGGSLRAYCDGTGVRWGCGNGFAFVVSQE